MAGPARAHVPSEGQSGQDPLAYWLAQEEAGEIGDLAAGPAAAEEPRLASGWWLLPVLVMALPVWGVIGWIMLR